MKKVLIVTTLNDLSLGLFATRKISEKFQVIFHFINESIDTLSQSFLREFDVIYIRDPFTDGYSRETLNEKLLHIINIAHLHDIRMIDSIVSLEDIYIEDKWIQYGKFSQYQTKTHLLNEYTNRYGLPESGTYIIKSRVSSRAKGIYFDIAEIG